MAVYNRHAYDVEKRQALSLWEQRLIKILEMRKNEPSNIIPFTLKAAIKK